MTSDPILEPPHAREGWRGEIAATFALAWPLALANFAQMLVHAVDVIFVARLGDVPLAASSLAIALFGLMIWSMSGITGMVAALISAELGRRRHAVREVRRSVRMGLWIAVLAGLFTMIVCAQGEWLMDLTGQDPKVSVLAGRFLDIVMFASIPMLLANVLRNFVSALGRPVFATMITVASIGVNVLGNYAFVFGNLGAPALGLEGSAISSVLTSCFIVVAYVVSIRADRRLRRYRILGNWWRPEWSRFRELLRTGTPVMLTVLAEAGLFSGAAFLMGRIGAHELAGHAVALQIAALAFQVPFGIAQAATIRVGYFYGAQDPESITRAGWTAIGLGMGFMLLTASAMMLAPHALLSIYVDPDAAANAAMVGFAMQYMRIAAMFQLFDGLQAVAAGALRGLQDTRVPMWLALFGYWIPGMGTAIGLGFYTPLEGAGVWLGFAAGLGVVALLLLWRWMKREKLALVPAKESS